MVDGELPAGTDVKRLSRFYLSVFEGMAIQARDGASRAELQGVAATAMAAWPAPNASIAFNTRPEDTAEAAARWV